MADNNNNTPAGDSYVTDAYGWSLVITTVWRRALITLEEW